MVQLRLYRSPGAIARAVGAALSVIVVTWGQVWAEGPQRLEIELEPHGRVSWSRGEAPVLLVRPRPGDGWVALARRYSGTPAAVGGLRSANPGLEQPLRDRRLRVPLTMLRADLRLATVGRLFPVDGRVAGGWEHSVLDPFAGGEESWEWLAELFTGRPADHGALRRANPRAAASGLRRGQSVLVPEALLLPVFRDLEPRPTPTPRVRTLPSARPMTPPPTAPPRPTATPSPTLTPPPTATPRPTATSSPTVTPTATSRPTVTPGMTVTPIASPTPGNGWFSPAASSGALTFERDAQGDYAVYRLRRGEALYSSVVVRFTGQLHAEEVNATAAEIARRSGIADVTSIPVGYAIRISLDLLLPEHLPPDHPRRLAWEAEQKELSRFAEIVHATDLSGVHVIVDAGHGGSDTGAAVGGVWESTYVYDIACRIKANLERHTRATVWMTRQDEGLGYRVPDKDSLVQDRDQFLLTRPKYTLVESTIGVHLRWYLANDIVLRRLGRDVPSSRAVFLSVHADSLHASVRGAMVYVPSRHLRPERYRVRLKELRTYQEYLGQPEVALGSDFKARSEASSRHLAGELLQSLGRNALMVHPYEPIRDRVLRGRQSWVPAVLRYTLAQHAVLVECCNMANAEDRELLRDRAWRERFARSVVEGMAAAFPAGS